MLQTQAVSATTKSLCQPASLYLPACPPACAYALCMHLYMQSLSLCVCTSILHLIQVWRTADAHEAHKKTAHYEQLVATIKAMADGEAAYTVLEFGETTHFARPS